jgi:hypothetical protein
MSKFRWWIPVIMVLLLLAVGVGVVLGAQGNAPVRLLSHYPTELLLEEASTMSDCAECHESEEFHRCSTCHDDHGTVELEEVPFYAVVALMGDVPEPGYVLLDDILPYREQPHTYVPLLDFLASQGVESLESVTLASVDEGFVTVDRENLTEEAFLMPFTDGVRFAADNLHGSTWIKGIRRIIVVGAEKPLTIDGEATSMGRLLLGPVRSVTVQQTEVMLKGEEDGEIREAQVGSRIEGVPVKAVVAHTGFSELVVRDAAGEAHVLTAEEAEGALLYQMRGETTLVLPERGRPQWITGVVAIDSTE